MPGSLFFRHHTAFFTIHHIIAVKYDPMGNRVYKSSTVDGVATSRKYIVDISGKLPTILCEIDTSDSSLEKSYIYADAQVLAQREHESDPNFYDESYYVHDRLGSVRMVVDYNDIDGYVFVANSYTYSPFGNSYADEPPLETVANPWQFTGQYHDAEINQYYLRARQYDPTMMRFTSRDPVKGKNFEPLTLHKYLYCVNDSINNTDLSGRVADRVAGALIGGATWHAAAIGIVCYGVATENDDLIMLGIGMEMTIPMGVAIGAIVGPNVPVIQAYAVQHIGAMVTAFELTGVVLGDPNPATGSAGVALTLVLDYIGFDTEELFDNINWIGEDD